MHTTTVLLLLVVFLPLLFAVLVPILGRAARRAALWLAIFHVLITAGLVTLTVPSLNFRAETEKLRSHDLIKFEPQSVPEIKNKASVPYRTNWTLLNLS